MAGPSPALSHLDRLRWVATGVRRGEPRDRGHQFLRVDSVLLVAPDLGPDWLAGFITGGDVMTLDQVVDDESFDPPIRHLDKCSWR